MDRLKFMYSDEEPRCRAMNVLLMKELEDSLGLIRMPRILSFPYRKGVRLRRVIPEGRGVPRVPT